MSVDYEPEINDIVINPLPRQDSNISVTRTTYNNTGSFRFWCQKVLPLVYDESLSYYELLCKVVNYLNNVIANVDALHDENTNIVNSFGALQTFVNGSLDNMTDFINNSDAQMTDYINDTKDALLEAYNSLQSYVNNYFDNLDVQQEINNKLDEMAEDGTLLTLLSPYFFTYVTPEMYGAAGDGVTDDTQAFKDCFAANTNIAIKNNYVLSDTIELLDGTNVICTGNIKDNRETGSAAHGLFELSDSCSWVGGHIEGTGALSAYTDPNRVLYAVNSKGITVKDVIIEKTPSIYAVCFDHCEDIFVKNVTVDEYTYGGIMLLNACKNALIDACKVTNGNQSTIANRYPISGSAFPENNNTNIADNITVQNCYIYDTNPIWEGIDFHGGHNIKVLNNTIVGTYAGIVLTPYTTTPEENGNCKDCIIKNNYIELATVGTSLNISNSGIIIAKTTNAICEGNIIKNAGALSTSEHGRSGVTLQQSSYITFINNVITDCVKYGITINGLKNSLISNNNIKGNDVQNDFAFDFLNSINTDKLIIEGNIVQDYNRLYYGMNTAYSKPELRIYFKNNKFYSQYALTVTNTGAIIPDKFYNPARIDDLVAGEAGDFILNAQPTNATYPYVGWICTQSGTANSNAVWVGIPMPTP